MKIWYEHPYGRLDKYDIQLCKVYAEVEPEEGELALSQGFIDLDSKWQQMRSTRINIDEYVKQQPKYKQRKGVSVEKWKGSFAQNMWSFWNPSTINTLHTTTLHLVFLSTVMNSKTLKCFGATTMKINCVLGPYGASMAKA